MDQDHLQCWKCKEHRAVENYLAGLVAWWPQIGAAQHVCHACGDKTEVQLASGKISLGYIYAAGTAHFCAMQELSVPELVVGHESGELVVSLGVQAWRIPPKA